MMVRRSTWWSTAIGTAAGTVVGVGGWFLGMGKHFSTTHPGWALFGITLVVTIVAEMVAKSTIEDEIRFRDYRAQAAQRSPRTAGR